MRRHIDIYVGNRTGFRSDVEFASAFIAILPKDYQGTRLGLIIC